MSAIRSLPGRDQLLDAPRILTLASGERLHVVEIYSLEGAITSGRFGKAHDIARMRRLRDEHLAFNILGDALGIGLGERLGQVLDPVTACLMMATKYGLFFFVPGGS